MASKQLSIVELREHLMRSLKDELDAAQHCNTIIVSSELIHSRLRSADEIARLLRFFDGYVDRISLVVFLRRQDRLAVSNFSASLRAGYANFDGVFVDRSSHRFLRTGSCAEPNDYVDFYDFNKLLDRFSSFVAKADTHTFLFEDDVRSKSPHVYRITDIANVPRSALQVSGAPLNQSLTLEQQYAFCQVNRVAPITLKNGRRNKGLKAIHGKIEETIGGGRRTFPRADAKAFLERFSDSNEAVRAAYFPDREVLFEADFEAYPETVEPFIPDENTKATADKFAALAQLLSDDERTSKQAFQYVKNKVRSIIGLRAF
ncbi:MAG: hypothetical protein AAGG69_09565 [Pseudomonadota bacterium]